MISVKWLPTRAKREARTKKQWEKILNTTPKQVPKCNYMSIGKSAICFQCKDQYHDRCLQNYSQHKNPKRVHK